MLLDVLMTMIQHLKRNIENVTYEVLIFEYTWHR
jgi:hypothetical protein